MEVEGSASLGEIDSDRIKNHGRGCLSPHNARLQEPSFRLCSFQSHIMRSFEHNAHSHELCHGEMATGPLLSSLCHHWLALVVEKILLPSLACYSL